jgi:hypothetical protein
MQPSTTSKILIFYTSTLPPRHGFVTHRCAHMRACSLHRRAHMHAGALHRCASVCTCFFHRRALTCTYSPYRRVEVHACQTHRRALVRACSTDIRALNPLYRPPMHVYLVGRHARKHAYHWIASACGAHTP